MMRASWSAVAIAITLVAMTPGLPNGTAAAQQPVRTLDIGGPPGDTTSRACLSDSLVAAALAAFNSAGVVRAFGDFRTPVGDTVRGSVGMYQGQFFLAGTVRGDVIVLNGDARVTSTGVVTGTITMLGGQLTRDPGSSVGGTFQCAGQPTLTKLPNGTVARVIPRRSIGSITSGLGWTAGDYRLTPHVGIGQYNRVEALPIQLGINAARQIGSGDSLHAQAYGIARTGRDPSGSRPSLGWHASALYAHTGSLPLTIGVEGGSTIDGTNDRPFSPVESGASAFLFRNDYKDWYLRRGASITATLRPIHEVAVTGGFDLSRETTVQAIDAFSLFDNTDSWRPNPLIDDGTYRTVRGRVEWDARNPVEHPVLSWFVRADIQHVSSNDLTPVSLPATIRDGMPTNGYGETEGELDVRATLRIDPEQLLNFRVFGGGYMDGDPLTIQRRRALGGADPMIGYEFRGINCDRRRRPDPATPALCDRSAAMQAEYHRTLPIAVSTRIGNYKIGIRKPDLVLLADAGSAWLAGDSAGRVPTDRIQALREWKSDVGVGLTSGPFGLYLAKALTDAIPVQLTLLFSRRF